MDSSLPVHQQDDLARVTGGRRGESRGGRRRQHKPQPIRTDIAQRSYLDPPPHNAYHPSLAAVPRNNSRFPFLRSAFSFGLGRSLATGAQPINNWHPYSHISERASEAFEDQYDRSRGAFFHKPVVVPPSPSTYPSMPETRHAHLNTRSSISDMDPVMITSKALPTLPEPDSPMPEPPFSVAIKPSSRKTPKLTYRPKIQSSRIELGGSIYSPRQPQPHDQNTQDDQHGHTPTMSPIENKTDRLFTFQHKPTLPTNEQSRQTQSRSQNTTSSTPTTHTPTFNLNLDHNPNINTRSVHTTQSNLHRRTSSLPNPSPPSISPPPSATGTAIPAALTIRRPNLYNSTTNTNTNTNMSADHRLAQIEQTQSEILARLDRLAGRVDRVLKAVEPPSTGNERNVKGKRSGRGVKDDIRGNLVGMPPHIPFGGRMEEWYERVKREWICPLAISMIWVVWMRQMMTFSYDDHEYQ